MLLIINYLMMDHIKLNTDDKSDVAQNLPLATVREIESHEAESFIGRVRRAAPRRKIPLAKAPKPTTTSTTTTTTTAPENEEPADGETKQDDDEEEQAEDNEEQVDLKSKQASSSNPPIKQSEVTARSKPAGTSSRQQLSDKKGRKIETIYEGLVI